MSKIITLSIVLLLVCMVSSSSAQAEKTPVQLSLFTPVQIFPESTPISGLRFNLFYGRSVSLTGLDLGLVNHTTTGNFKGAQFGFVGITEGNFVGLQHNTFNFTKGNFEGFQWGLFNKSNYVNGFQLGLVNYAQSMKGLQIGLVNIIKQGGQFPVFPIINWSF